MESLSNKISVFNPAVIMLQETKLTRKNQIEIPGYQVYESIREDKGGGGLMTAVSSEINSAFISEGDSEADFLVVEVTIVSQLLA